MRSKPVFVSSFFVAQTIRALKAAISAVVKMRVAYAKIFRKTSVVRLRVRMHLKKRHSQSQPAKYKRLFRR
jgi:hypothetical protein